MDTLRCVTGPDDSMHDVTIIGGGPTGLFAAFYCGMRGLSCQIIDALPELGGQLSTLYPTKDVFDVAGFPRVRARELVDLLREQAMTYGPTLRLGEQVLSLGRRDDGAFDLATSRGVRPTRAVLLTVGIGAFRPRPIPLEDAVRYQGRGIHYFIDDVDAFRGKKVLVVGGGDSAVDFALMLEAVAKPVTLVHRRSAFRAHEASVRTLLNSTVRVYTDCQLRAISGDRRVQGAQIARDDTEEAIELSIDAIVSGLGFIASLGPIADWGLETQKGHILVSTDTRTSIPGVFAAGDCATYPGKVRLIATGFGEAATAVNNIKAYVDPAAPVNPGHSSDRSAVGDHAPGAEPTGATAGRRPKEFVGRTATGEYRGRATTAVGVRRPT